MASHIPPATFRTWVIGILAGLVLGAFIWLFGEPLWDQLFAQNFQPTPPADEAADPKTFLATAVAALVGGVAAAFLGVELPRKKFVAEDWTFPDLVRAVYVIVYIIFGAAAVVAWIKHGNSTEILIRNLAVTFIGLVTPAVGAYVGVRQGANGGGSGS
jgi:hypothetical protein